MKTIKEMIEVMKAYDEGKRIECRGGKGKDYSDLWELNDEPSWNWRDFDYRIRPRIHKRPMTMEEIISYWKEHRDEIYTVNYDGCVCLSTIDEVSPYYGKHCTYPFHIGTHWLSLEDFIENVTKEDGSKFEVEE